MKTTRAKLLIRSIVNVCMNTTQGNLPILLVHESMIPHFSGHSIDALGIITYISPSDAWTIAEQHEIAIFVSSHGMDFRVLVGLLSGMQILSPEMVHLHVYRKEDADELITLVNRSGVVRLLNSENLDADFVAFCTDALAAYLRTVQTRKELEELREVNEQYELMLRHSLLS